MLYIPTTHEDLQPVVAWALPRLPGAGDGFGECRAVAVMRDNRIAAAAIYYNFRGVAGIDRQCEISFASDDPNWATRQTVTFILHYPLVQLDCRRITALTEADNERVHRLLSGVGFVREGRHLDMFGDKPAVSFGMTQRWFLKSKWHRWYGKKVQSVAA